MLWLVESEVGSARDGEGGHKAPSLVADRSGELNPLLLQLLDRSLDVVAHQIELMVAIRLRGMDRKLRWRELEDEPLASGVNRRKAEYIANECPGGFRIVREDDCVRPDDHSTSLLFPGGRRRVAAGGPSDEYVRSSCAWEAICPQAQAGKSICRAA
jgi:hypothetical protein